MKAQIEAVALVIALFVVTVGMGLAFGGSGLGGPPMGGDPASGGAGVGRAAELVFRAEGVNSSDLYMVSSYASFPPAWRVPLQGFRAGLSKVEAGANGAPLVVPAGAVVTNSTGMATIRLPPGNYSVSMAGRGYSLDASISAHYNETISLDLFLSPSAEPVIYVRAVSPDAIGGLEPSSVLYALLGNGSAATARNVELLGYAPGGGGPPVTLIGTTVPRGNFTLFYFTQSHLVGINATVLGGYQGPFGRWIILSPSGSFSAFPTSEVRLIWFKPTCEVTYLAG